MLGRTISHYRIEDRVGQGGMGIVYLATDLQLQRRVAIKFATAGDGVDRQRLQAEARAASRLAHPGIAHIYELGQSEDGQPFFVMEYVPGRNLSDLLAAGPLEITTTLDVMRALASALAEAHRHGVVHRDIKPANIRVTDGGEVKVLDFGLAKTSRPAGPAAGDGTLTAPLIETGLIEGTPGYLAPEQASGKPVDARSDLFSTGCVLYQCLTGKRPFVGESLLESMLLTHGHTPPAPSSVNKSAPAWLDAVAARLLQKDPALRYQSAGELLADLEAGGAKKGLLASRRVRVAVVALAAIAAASAGWWLWSSRPYLPKPEAARWFEEGSSALRDGTFLKASKALGEAVRLDPDFVLARAHLAEAWIELDEAGRAKDEMLRLQRSPHLVKRLGKADRLHLEAIEYLVTGDHRESIARYRSMLGLAAENAQAYMDLGQACERAGDSGCALDSYRQAVKLDPQYAAGHLRLGLLQRRMRKDVEAERSLQESERLYQAASNVEGLTEAQYGLGALQSERAEPARARETLEKALAAARLTANVQQQVKILMQLAALGVKSADEEEVRQRAQQAVDLARSAGAENLASRALITLGGAFFQTGKAEAERYYTQALDIARRNRAAATEARALLALGSLHSTTGQSGKAVAELEPAALYFRQAGFHAEGFRASVLLARTRRKDGDLEGAERVLRELLPETEKIGTREEQALLHEAVGQVEFLRGAYRAAARSFERSYELNEAAGNKPGVVNGLLNRARQTWRLGDSARAKALLAEAETLAAGAGLKAAAGDARLERVLMALSEGRFGEALASVDAVESTGTPGDAEGRMRLESARALALGGAGRAAAGLALCGKLLHAETGAQRGWPLPEARLECAAVALAARDQSQALAWAGLARQDFERSRNPEALWRALTLMALSGSPMAGRPAMAALSELERTWDGQDFKRYLNRPDVKRLREQLGKLEGTS
ncbi:MAG: protein kinase [Candidatus Solibacter usitatus]|nr:protein kinase [Candidatus Solibacter usitatus]